MMMSKAASGLRGFWEPPDQFLIDAGKQGEILIARSDVLARYGGEEFVVLFRETSAGQAMERVEHIRRTVESEPLLEGTAAPVRVTVSAGIASWPADGDAVADLIAEADRRLFEAKNAGRNRVVGPAHAADEAAETAVSK